MEHDSHNVGNNMYKVISSSTASNKKRSYYYAITHDFEIPSSG